MKPNLTTAWYSKPTNAVISSHEIDFYWGAWRVAVCNWGVRKFWDIPDQALAIRFHFYEKPTAEANPFTFRAFRNKHYIIRGTFLRDPAKPHHHGRIVLSNTLDMKQWECLGLDSGVARTGVWWVQVEWR